MEGTELNFSFARPILYPLSSGHAETRTSTRKKHCLLLLGLVTVTICAFSDGHGIYFIMARLEHDGKIDDRAYFLV